MRGLIAAVAFVVAVAFGLPLVMDALGYSDSHTFVRDGCVVEQHRNARGDVLAEEVVCP